MGLLVTPYVLDVLRQRLEAAGAVVLQEKISGNTYNVLVQKPLK
jgi:hypothetical protein